ncbi:putative thiocyanate methyltransferase 2 [Smittium culicis]|uniref:Putative thiocyanate methyltransferase 2 n=1 Tax=Smittium culicis TaxID=133412 RepID=A0A1R1XQA9_9FUNG|nr:putative thiocyanate methyltransferase 2 [Smittium culicis]
MEFDQKPAIDYWEHRWANNQAAWDFGKTQIALIQLFEENKFQFPTKANVLVPGCGSGYDAIYFSQLGYDTTGLDFSASANQKAKELAANSQTGPGQLQFVQADFYNFPAPSSLYQIAYDYTFLSTVRPEDRIKWGSRYADLISPGGFLITLIFPIDFGNEDGPPFKLNKEMCHQVLDPNFDLVYQDLNPNKEPPRTSASVMAIWKRK